MMETTPALRALDELREKLRGLPADGIDLMAVEWQIREVVEAVGLELFAEVLRRADTELPEVSINGVSHGTRRVTPGTYYSTFGAVEFERSTYRAAGTGPIAVPMELRLGLVEGHYSPRLATVMAMATATLPREEAEALLETVGVARVSVSTLHRIPQMMMARYERDRVIIEPLVRGLDRVPAAAMSAQVSLDGVMTPQDGEYSKPRGRPTEDPEPPRHEQRYGPSQVPGTAANDGQGGRPWHEASVGTIAFVDANGEVLKTIYCARMPEPLKATMERILGDELLTVIGERPDLHITFASDGAPSHWDILARIEARLPATATGRRRRVLDIFHLLLHLSEAATAIWADEKQAKVELEHWRTQLRIYDDGATRVLKALRHQYGRMSTRGKGRDIVLRAIDYLWTHRRAGHVEYAQLLREGQLVGTGVVEAAAKTVVSVRMKRAGARYSQHGGQTIMTLRAAHLSGRMKTLIRLVSETYTAKVAA